MRTSDRGSPYGVPSGRVMLTVTYGALSNTSNAKDAFIALLAFLILSNCNLHSLPFHALPRLIAKNLRAVAKEAFPCLFVATEPVAHPGCHIGIATL